MTTALFHDILSFVPELGKYAGVYLKSEVFLLLTESRESGGNWPKKEADYWQEKICEITVQYTCSFMEHEQQL